MQGSVPVPTMPEILMTGKAKDGRRVALLDDGSIKPTRIGKVASGKRVGIIDGVIKEVGRAWDTSHNIRPALEVLGGGEDGKKLLKWFISASPTDGVRAISSGGKALASGAAGFVLDTAMRLRAMASGEFERAKSAGEQAAGLISHQPENPGAYAITTAFSTLPVGAKKFFEVASNLTDDPELKASILTAGDMAEFIGFGSIGKASLTKPKVKPPKEMKLYHGGPHDIVNSEKGVFSSDKRFSGEGSNVFGEGHYLSELKEIGKDYADMTSAKGRVLLDGVPAEKVHPAFSEVSGLTKPEIRDYFSGKIEGLYEDLKEGQSTDMVDYYKSALEMVDKKDLTFDSESHLYEVALRPQGKDFKFFDWFGEVADRKKISKIAQKRGGLSKQEYNDLISTTGNGKDFYKKLGGRIGDGKASEVLYEAGYDAIKYPTYSVYSEHGSHSNYVALSDKGLRISDHERISGKKAETDNLLDQLLSME